MTKARKDDLQRDQDWLVSRLDLLHRTNQAILAAHTTAEITKSALMHLMAMLPARRASVALFDHEQSLMLLADVLPEQSSGPVRGWQAPLHNVWFLEHLEHDQVVCDEHLQDARGSAWAEALRAAGVVSFSAVPLIAKGALLGSLNISLLSGQCLAERDREMLWQVADHLAVALEHERLQRELEEHASHLEQLVAHRTTRIRAASARFRVLFQQAPMGIMVVDDRGRIEMANPALAEITCYLARELNELRLEDIVQENECSALNKRLRALFSGDKRPSHQEVGLLCKDGALRWARITLSLFNPHQTHTSALVMIQDIHEERVSLEALVESEKLTVLGRMAATLVHEINNPLQVVLGCLGLAEETAAEGQDVSRYLEVAHEELTRTAKIVARLRDMQHQSYPMAADPTDLTALMDQVLALVEVRCIDQKIQVHREAATLPTMQVVPDRITQVYLNLVINALDAMPDGGHLEVAFLTTDEPAGIQTTIADTGAGMAASKLEHLFEPFGSTKSRGLGLGLYISHKIIQEHSGTIEVSSHVGQGTIFAVWLPLQEEQNQ